MKLTDRIKNYKAIEDKRKRPLIVYATSTRSGVPAQMAADAVREFIDQIDVTQGEAVDILILSTGGDALTAWKLMSMLRERFKSVAVLVPYFAFSAATIFALGADEIVMHPHASLGPIDPQIGIRLPDGTQRQFSFEDVGAFIRFVSKEMGITEQAHVTVAMEKLFSVVDPVHVGGAKRASELSTDVGERLLQMHMTGAEEKIRARTIAEGLNKTFFAHGDAVSRSRARTLNLKVAPDNADLEKVLWTAYLGIESYMELRAPYKPLEHFLANGGAPAVTAVGPVALPPNAPPQVVNQVWGQIAQQATQVTPQIDVDYKYVNALVESARCASEYRTEGVLNGFRAPNGEIRLAATDRVTGWQKVSV